MAPAPPYGCNRSSPLTLAPDDIAAAVIDLVRDDNAVAEARIVTNS